MHPLARKQSLATSRDSSSRTSDDSYDSQGTPPTSLPSSPTHSYVRQSKPVENECENECEHECDDQTVPEYDESDCESDLSPSTNCCPRATFESYASTTASDEELQLDSRSSSSEFEYSEIPPLQAYDKDLPAPYIRTSTPDEFARLFPSMDRLSVRHDEFTSDGNMNLRVDGVTLGRKKPIQLFHLRMYDLAKREFSLRRYCRDSGREVCNSKRKLAEPGTEGRPTLQRSMTTALKSLGGTPTFKRTNSGASIFSTKRPGTSGSLRRSGTSHSSQDGTDDDLADTFSKRSMSFETKPRPAPPSKGMKLEFSNYARVDIERRGGKNNKRYDFAWWGHKYSWKLVQEKHLDMVNFHLMRDGKDTPIAHIVPETRTRNQVVADEQAGGWVPPCHMWICDQSILDAVTDVADVIIATGLMSLVDNCIKEHWQPDKMHHMPFALHPIKMDGALRRPKAFVQHMFSRQNSGEDNSFPNHHHRPGHGHGHGHGHAVRAY